MRRGQKHGATEGHPGTGNVIHIRVSSRVIQWVFGSMSQAEAQEHLLQISGGMASIFRGTERSKAMKRFGPIAVPTTSSNLPYNKYKGENVFCVRSARQLPRDARDIQDSLN